MRGFHVQNENRAFAGGVYTALAATGAMTQESIKIYSLSVFSSISFQNVWMQ